jgi:hypothetical protein
MRVCCDVCNFSCHSVFHCADLQFEAYHMNTNNDNTEVAKTIDLPVQRFSTPPVAEKK